MSVRFLKMSEGKSHDSGLCERNLNFLAHAQAIELEIGSRCGGHGVCGGDRIHFKSEERTELSPITEAEELHLSPQEIRDGWRLACQCFPEKNDLSFEPEVP